MSNMTITSFKSPPEDAVKTTENSSNPRKKETTLENSEEETEEEERKRGWKLWLFTLNMSAVAMSFVLLAIYNNVALRTFEKRFSLSSFQTGILGSTNDLMQISLSIFIAYFGGKSHKPRILSFTVMFAAVSGFMMASPHFIFNDSKDATVSKHTHDSSALHNSSVLLSENLWQNLSKISEKIKYCKAHKRTNEQCIQQRENSLTEHPAYYIFIIAQLVSGIGKSALYSLSLSYLDENAPKFKLPLYLCELWFFKFIFNNVIYSINCSLW